MQSVRIALAAAVIVAFWGGASANAQSNGAKAPKPRIIYRDRSIFYPPPSPHERRYVGPGPALSAPMQRIPDVAPLAQPPIR